jgi:hypothetical protein
MPESIGMDALAASAPGAQQVALRDVSETRFRFVCVPSALAGTPAGWAREMLEEGEVALLAAEGIDAVDHVAHELDQRAIVLVRTEQNGDLQDQTVMAYAAALPLVWVASEFSDAARSWARDRGPMTLLTESIGPLGGQERRRIDRFLAILGRQSE